MTLVLGLTAPAVVLPGCAFFSKTEPGSDAVVVNAERVAKLSFTMADTFLEWEYNNRASVPPAVIQAADTLRDNFPQAYNGLRLATKTYKSTRSLMDRTAMEDSMVNLQSLTTPAANYLPPAVRTRAEIKASHLENPPDLATATAWPK